MKQRYIGCEREDGNCEACSMSSYDKDCQNNPVNLIAYLRMRKRMTQAQLAQAAGIALRHVQRIEDGSSSMESMKLCNAIALADVLGVSVYDLI